MSGEPIIRLANVTKRYGRTVAVDGLSLEVREGEVFGLLGPNGSGKTTTILLIMGLTEKTSGTLEVLGHDTRHDTLTVKRLVGYMPDSLGFYDAMTGRQSMRYTGRLLRMSGRDLEAAIEAALEQVKLSDVADKRVKTYSHGMRQRLGFAEILLKKPKVAILDEPTSGLDPEAVHRFLELVRGLKQGGTTVVLSSHLLDQVQSVCDRVALFHGGHIVIEGRVGDLASQVLGDIQRFRVEGSGHGLEGKLAAIDGVVKVVPLASETFRVDARADVRQPIVTMFGRAGYELRSLSTIEPSLDEVYRRVFEETRDAA